MFAIPIAIFLLTGFSSASIANTGPKPADFAFTGGAGVWDTYTYTVTVSNDNIAQSGTPDVIKVQVYDVTTSSYVNGVIVNFAISGLGSQPIASGNTGITGVAEFDFAGSQVGSLSVTVTDASGNLLGPGNSGSVGVYTLYFIAGSPVTTANPGVSGTLLSSVLDDQLADGVAADQVKAYITDAYGNPIPNTWVTFVIEPGGTITTGLAALQGGGQTYTVQTGSDGSVTIPITSTMAGTVNINAYLGQNVTTGTPINGSTLTMTFVTPTPDAALSTLVVDVSPEPADGVAQDVLHAHIVDANGVALPNQTVTFTITGGTASGTAVTTTLTVTTDASGNATVDVTNTQVGSVIFAATVGGSPVGGAGNTATVNFVTPVVTPSLSSLVVDVTGSPADGTTQDIIHAHIVDQAGVAMANQTVTFTISGGTAAGTAVTTTLTVTTDASGNATVDITNTVVGTVSFTATVAGTSITTGSPATVTFVTPVVDPALSTLVVDISPSPADGVTQDVLHAHIVDQGGAAMANQTVTFTITGGTASGTAVTTTLTVTTDASGNATVDVTNTVVGTVIFGASVGGVAIGPTGTPASATVAFVTPVVDPALSTLVVQVSPSPADGVTQDILYAHIVDQGGAAMANQTVTFTISGGTASGTAVTTTLTVTTDASGNAYVDVTNTVVGSVTFTATVGGVPVGGIANPASVEVDFITPTPDVTNPATAIIVDIPSATADGTSQTELHAHVVSSSGVVVAGATVTFTITGGTASGTAVTTTLTGTTDASGNLYVYVTDVKVGTVIFTATVGGVSITNGSPATVTFVVGPPVSVVPPNGSNPSSPNSPAGTATDLAIITNNALANGTATDSLTALITDANGNPEPNITVTFTITGGSASGSAVVQQVTATTNSQGIAVYSISNTTAGEVDITASMTYAGVTTDIYTNRAVEFVNQPDVNNPATQLIVVIEEAIANGMGVTEVKAHVVDQNGNVIPDQPVTFSIDSGTATILTQQPVQTDANGDAIIQLVSNTPGYVLVTATVDGMQIKYGSPARVQFAPVNIYVPRAFSPNGDGVNDVLKPIVVGMASFHYFSVYNRWGNLIFTTQDPNSGWDGTWKGVAQPVETYLWIAEGVTTEGKTVVQKGMTSLVR